MWCYANHPLTLPILFTLSLGGGQPGTPRPFIWKSGQTVKRQTPAARWALIFTTSLLISEGRDTELLKNPRQLRQFLRRGGKYRSVGGRGKFSQKAIQRAAHLKKKGGQKCTLIGESVVLQSLRRFKKEKKKI